MRLVVGLGNPGEKYENTRHNIGFRILDKIAEKQGIGFSFEKKFEAEISENDNMKLAKPQTFMNESGKAVQKIADFYKIDHNNIIVIHDDVDLEIGKIRISCGGSSAGHKGVQSIIDHLGSEDFWRVRVGVGRDEKIPTEEWVLMNFSSDEKGSIDNIIDKTSDYLIESLDTGINSKTINVGA